MSDILARITTEGWVAIGLSAFVTYLFADHFVHATREYVRLRGARRLRGWMLAALLLSGVLGILMGNIARYIPELADAARFMRWVAVGMLFVGGITTWITWRLGDEQ